MCAKTRLACDLKKIISAINVIFKKIVLQLYFVSIVKSDFVLKLWSVIAIGTGQCAHSLKVWLCPPSG